MLDLQGALECFLFQLQPLQGRREPCSHHAPFCPEQSRIGGCPVALNFWIRFNNNHSSLLSIPSPSLLPAPTRAMLTVASPFPTLALGVNAIPPRPKRDTRVSSRVAFLPTVQHSLVDPELDSGFPLSIYDDLLTLPQCWNPLNGVSSLDLAPLDCPSLSPPNCIVPEDFLHGAQSGWSSEGAFLRLVSSSPSLDSDFSSTTSSTPSPPPSFRHDLNLSDEHVSNYFNFDYGSSFVDNCLDPVSVLSKDPSPFCLPGPSTPDYSLPMPSAGASSLFRQTRSRETSPSTSDSSLHNQKRRFPCGIPGCPRRFTSQYTLKVHMEAHKPKPKVSFPCTEGCSERFSRQHDRLRHEVAKHGKICEFSCEECGRFFSTKKTLGNHKCPVAQGGTRWVTN
ncbi:hypothetical protein BDN72DRAFT_643942 [Pluteus cervinus]|uniref:Uncharacterized protein n=1 Tax=Pluteus cervinus TaxID=181527 RepID=A0ACD3AU90_9AGAR|nr:hypothetical protein BDN72DRAFT_643942 [Pluteus cervinus]